MNERLVQLRDILLALHSVLLSYQKHEYELDNKPITSPNEYFGLVTSHPSFEWLRRLSELLASLDEFVDGKGNDTVNEKDLLTYIKKLLDSSEKETDFGKKYLKAKQKNPEVALTHGKVMELL